MTIKQLIALQKKRVEDKKTGRLQRLARRRFLKDLLEGEKRGIYFSIKRAERVVKFIEKMPHVKGDKAGEPFKLETWQKYDIIYPLFGFYKIKDGKKVRRFNVAYVEIARKNGKSMLASAIANYLAFADGEFGAEVYAVATKRDQAKIVWETSEVMKNHSFLKKHVVTAYSKMMMKKLNAKYEPLGADSNTQDGLNVHGAIIDEYHAHPTSAMYDVIRSATGARKQPLIFIITTAGFNQESPCFQEHKYAIDILEGTIQNDSYFAFIATIDEGDDPFDEKVWIKANPNLGISVKLDDFRNIAKEAQDKPSAYNNFLTKKLNVWTNSVKRWIPAEKWRASAGIVNEKELEGKLCYVGLDLASTTDITAFVMVFPINDVFKVLCRFWIPEENMLERSKNDKVPYYDWVRAGYIKTTPGRVADYDFIEADIKRECERFNVKYIAYDRWNALSLVKNLENEGVAEMVAFGQGFASMSAPTKEIEALVLQKRLHHGNNPVLNWMCSNVAIKMDPTGAIKIDKSKSHEKVDGMVALAMAIGVMLANKKNQNRPSIYEQRGLRTL